MNEYSKKAWEALFNPPGYGSLLPGPRVEMLEVPTWVDNAYELVVPVDTPEVNIAFADGGGANTLTITLPASAKCVGKTITLRLAQTGTVCIIAVANVLSGFGSEDAANGVYVLHAITVGGTVVWAPTVVAAIETNT